MGLIPETWSLKRIAAAFLALWAAATLILMLVSHYYNQANDPTHTKIGRFNRGDLSPYFEDAEGTLSLLEGSIFKPTYPDGVIGGKTVYEFDEPSMVNDSRGFEVAISTIHQSLLVDCDNDTFWPTQFEVYSGAGLYSVQSDPTERLSRQDFYHLDAFDGLYQTSVQKICAVYHYQLDYD